MGGWVGGSVGGYGKGVRMYIHFLGISGHGRGSAATGEKERSAIAYMKE